MTRKSKFTTTLMDHVEIDAAFKPIQSNIFAEQVEMPKAIMLEHSFSFYDEDGIFHEWPSNKIIRNKHSIAELVERKAPVIAIKETPIDATYVE